MLGAGSTAEGKVGLGVPHGADTSVRKDRQETNKRIINSYKWNEETTTGRCDRNRLWGLIHSGWAGVACWRRWPLSWERYGREGLDEWGYCGRILQAVGTAKCRNSEMGKCLSQQKLLCRRLNAIIRHEQKAVGLHTGECQLSACGRKSEKTLFEVALQSGDGLGNTARIQRLAILGLAPSALLFQVPSTARFLHTLWSYNFMGTFGWECLHPGVLVTLFPVIQR